MLKWRILLPKHGTWKFPAKIDFIMAMSYVDSRVEANLESGKYCRIKTKSMVAVHRKMIDRGNVRDVKVLIKCEALPLIHDTCDCSSLRTRMLEGEGIVTGMKC